MTTASPPTATHRRWLVAAFVISFCAVGIMHWPIPYADVSLPNSLIGAGLVLVVLAAVLARVKGHATFWITTLVVGAAVLFAKVARHETRPLGAGRVVLWLASLWLWPALLLGRKAAGKKTPTGSA